MPDCDYCPEAFDSEDAYLNHLVSEHEDELGGIDKLRVRKTIDTEKRSSLKIVGAGAGTALLLGGTAYAITSMTSQEAEAPGKLTSKATITEDFSRNHIHGIAYDYDETRLYLPTHYGLFVLIDSDLYLVGDSLDDHMGFNMHPENPAVLYRSGHAKTGGNLGVEYSEDGGLTWERIFSGVRDETVDFHSMTISDADPDVLLGTYAGHLYVTEDGGESWRTADSQGLPSGVITLAAHTSDRSTVFAGTSGGLFESTTLGDSWERRTTDVFTAIRIHPTDANTRYGYTRDGLVRSDDGGDTWTVLYPAAEFGGDEYVFGFAVNRAAPDELYAATTKNRVFTSTDGGEAWTELLNN